MDNETFDVAAYSPGSPVKAAVSTEPLAQEQRWRCQVCGQEMAYSQPIGLALACMLISVFVEAHRSKCGSPSVVGH
jgi:hypothetical protein